MLDINDHSDQGSTGIEPALLSLAEGLNQTAVTNRTRRHFSDLHNKEYIDRRFNGITIGEKIMNEL